MNPIDISILLKIYYGNIELGLFETGQRAKKLWQCTLLTGRANVIDASFDRRIRLQKIATLFPAQRKSSFFFSSSHSSGDLSWFLIRRCGAPCDLMTINAAKKERNTIRWWTTRSQSFAQQRLNFFFCCSPLRIFRFFYSQSLFFITSKKWRRWIKKT